MTFASICETRHRKINIVWYGVVAYSYAPDRLSHSNPSALASKIAGIKAMSYHVQLFLLIQRNVFRIVQKTEKVLTIK